MKKIFITGGTGFFGKSLFKYLDLSQYDITLLSRPLLSTNPGQVIKQDVHVVRGDVRTFPLPKPDFDYILHGAATSSTIIPEDEQWDTIVEGTERVLKFAKQNKNLTNFLFISSGAVYGPSYFPLKESSPCNPVTIYGLAKLKAEQLCIRSHLPYSIARCFAFIGENLPLYSHFAMSNFIRDCLMNDEIIVGGDGTPIRSYLYEKDLAEWLYYLLLHPHLTVNVGSDVLISIENLAKKINHISGAKKSIRVLSPLKEGLPQCYAPNIDLAKSLGLEVTVPLDEAISRTLMHHLKEIHGSQVCN